MGLCLSSRMSRQSSLSSLSTVEDNMISNSLEKSYKVYENRGQGYSNIHRMKSYGNKSNKFKSKGMYFNQVLNRVGFNFNFFFNRS